MSELLKIGERVRALMRSSLRCELDDAEFNSVALALCAAQRKENAAYAKFTAPVGEIGRWEDIPAVPTSAFKQVEMTALPAASQTSVFFSSGTTQKDRSRHFHCAESLSLYEESLLLWFDEVFRNERQGVRWLFLTPNATQAPNSSLAHMFTTIAARHGGGVFAGRIAVDGGWEVDDAKCIEILAEAERSGVRVSIMGTAFLFVHLLDALATREINFRLPEGSWVLETGGYKGRSREIPKAELHLLLRERLGVSGIFGEYGMSELSSQAYASADGLFRFPPWARTRLISPATGREAREGERGLIRVYDLANVWSVMAVQTEDVAIKAGDGFRLVGRAAEAEARGCSLMTV